MWAVVIAKLVTAMISTCLNKEAALLERTVRAVVIARSDELLILGSLKPYG